MEGDSNQEKSCIDENLQTKLLVHNHHDHKGGMKTMPFIIGKYIVKKKIVQKIITMR